MRSSDSDPSNTRTRTNAHTHTVSYIFIHTSMLNAHRILAFSPQIITVITKTDFVVVFCYLKCAHTMFIRNEQGGWKWESAIWQNVRWDERPIPMMVKHDLVIITRCFKNFSTFVCCYYGLCRRGGLFWWLWSIQCKNERMTEKKQREWNSCVYMCFCLWNDQNLQ